MASSQTIALTIGHSPDPDDAFMWWPLGNAPGHPGPAIDTRGFSFTPVPDDIQALNDRAARRGDLDITACSMHAYPSLAGAYALTSCGASVGEGYGPKIVARESRPPEWLGEPGVRIATPGAGTTAALVARLLIGGAFDAVALPFERVIPAVLAGEADAGLVIHEAQLTYAELGLSLVVDLGEWWRDRTGLPLPLGGNAVRRDLDERFGAGTSVRLAGVLRASIEHALAERGAGVAYASGFAQPGTTAAQADRFISMYVNGFTLDLGESGTRGLEELYRRARAAGVIASVPPLDLVRPAFEGPG